MLGTTPLDLASFSDYEIDDYNLFQIRALSSLLALMIATPTSSQTTRVSQFVSPCPDVFTYDTAAIEPHKWNGVVTLTTDTTLYALWLNIVLDSKANILGVSLFITICWRLRPCECPKLSQGNLFLG